MITDAKLLTTGQAAKYCSVTPDTILKWIRSGFLPAHRTAGGHHRIDVRDLDQVLRPISLPQISPIKTVLKPTPRQRPFKYCWEFNGEGELLEECQNCAVYQMRAQRCYEVVRLAPEAGPLKLCCDSSCQDCDYYRVVHKQGVNVLVVSDDGQLTEALQKQAEEHEYNIEFTDCEYACSAAISSFRPDFAVVDCSLGSQLSQEICHHLNQDPRIPFVRVVLAASEGEFPTSCEKDIFARIQRPFSVQDIADCIEGASKKTSNEE
ncbi:MAG: excisionase family DNA-binding protein [Candidatus Latescibacteria bacterium]|nr:excisionase family DNA-binding protein [Candidatus Latescibacterota bacterium]NIO56728.1 excisionase family DNA-binding protein [Candidatus Latescibacterota bacterium]NIT02313.1 excisionase family DNA-binding protein [Candidatus Latescibacterota bacterium]NIT39196.1 excisionase family DNA-binding protein [Candidatus Latescibacterota bacterium]